MGAVPSTGAEIVAPSGEEYYDAVAVAAALQLEQAEARELAEIAAYVPDPHGEDDPVDLNAWREEVCAWREHLTAMTLEIDVGPDQTVQLVPLSQVCVSLLAYSAVPEAQAYLHWLCREFMPAIHRYGCYEPARNHEPPVGGELDALERREGARDLLDAILPGLGDLPSARRP